MTGDIRHPSEFIPESFSQSLRDHAGEAEALRDLHPYQLKLIHEQGWFLMFVPESLGGLGWSLPKIIQMEEALSWSDGSTGWVVTLCSGAAWFVGFMDRVLVQEILSGDNVCFAGSGAATGTAEFTGSGYDIQGMWKYASGSLHATVFTANCVVRKNKQSQYNDDGSPVVRPFLFLRDEVALHRHWNSMGMVATGSHSFSVEGLSLSDNRCFLIDPEQATLDDPIFQYPFQQLAETTLAINLSGMAVRFVDLCASIFEEKMKRRSGGDDSPDLQEILGVAKAELAAYRADYYHALNASWQLCVNRDLLSSTVLNEVSDTSHALANGAVSVVDTLYRWCGLKAADTSEEINRVWRNIHTASQHSLFARR